MNVKLIEDKDISELAEMIDRRIDDIFLLSEILLHKAEPQNEEAEEHLSNLADFVTILENTYTRVKSSLNEMMG
jgi:hypothetical protein